MDGMLSQDEINALLNGMDSGSDDASEQTSTVSQADFLSDMEKDTMGEISNISMGTAATTLSSLVNQKVDITTPSVTFSRWEDLVASYDRPCVFLQISYKEGLSGNNVLILRDHDVKIIADLMMGGDGTNTDVELGELQLSAISEAMNQMMGSASTSLSSMLNLKIDISPPTASLIDLGEAVDQASISEFLKHDFVKISFRMTIGDLVDSEMMQLFPIEFCKTLCHKFGVGEEESAAPEITPQPEPPVQQAPAQSAPADQQPMANNGYGMPMGGQGMQMQQGMQGGYGMPMQGMPMQGMPNMGMPGYGMPMQQGMPMGYQMPPMQEVNVSPVSFQAFSPDLVAVNQKENINLIMDVPLEVTVELGRTHKSIQDILEFAPGTIIELNKIAGEPIDVLVNGKYVAKGEVVVIEESFGVRVTEIIK